MAINIVTPKTPQAPALPPGLASSYVLIKEKFPKVAEQIALKWGTIGLQEYLSKIIFDERGGRQGFPMAIVSALMQLHEFHSTLLPQATASSEQVWEDAK
jgi:hypothetical protein